MAVDRPPDYTRRFIDPSDPLHRSMTEEVRVSNHRRRERWIDKTDPLNQRVLELEREGPDPDPAPEFIPILDIVEHKDQLFVLRADGLFVFAAGKLHRVPIVEASDG